MAREFPVFYPVLSSWDRKLVREQYVREQNGLCMYCKESLSGSPPRHITKKKIDWSYFPPNFQKYPIHLQHNHDTGMTEGAVHMYCNAVMWQYEHR